MATDRNGLLIAGKQFGLITRAQALRCGLTDDQIRHRLHAGSLVAVHRGVYLTLGSVPSFAQRALAGCLACGPGALASHRTAAALFKLIDPTDGPVEITTPTRRCPRPAGVTVHRSRLLDAGERARVAGVPTTSVARTLLDLAAVVSVERLEAAADEAFRRGLVTPSRTLAYLARSEFRRSRGSGGLRALVHDRVEGIPESVLESRMLRLLRMNGLPEPVRQLEAHVRGRIVRFDFAYPEYHLAIELDGRAPHWGRERWQSDHDRHNATEVAGWRTLRFTWWDVTERPLYVLLVVGEALGLRPARWRPQDRSSLGRQHGSSKNGARFAAPGPGSCSP